MNVSILDKLEKGWISLDWSKYLIKMNLTESQLSELVDKLDNWKSNKSCKSIILMKYKVLPAYIILNRSDFKRFSIFLLEILTKREMYEECARISKISNKL
jgi:hypothetical protein